MAQITVSLRMDEHLKAQADRFCDEVGMSMSTAITMFFKRLTKDQRFPFEIAADSDPFYSGANYRHIMEGIRSYEAGEPGIVKTMEELEAMANE